MFFESSIMASCWTCQGSKLWNKRGKTWPQLTCETHSQPNKLRLQERKQEEEFVTTQHRRVQHNFRCEIWLLFCSLLPCLRPVTTRKFLADPATLKPGGSRYRIRMDKLFWVIAILIFLVVTRSLPTILNAGCWSQCATPNGWQSLLTAPKWGLECSGGKVEGTAYLYRTQVAPADGTPATHSNFNSNFIHYKLHTLDPSIPSKHFLSTNRAFSSHLSFFSFFSF